VKSPEQENEPVTNLRRIPGVVFGLAVLCCVLACGGAIKQAQQKVKDLADIQQLGMSYHSYANTKGNGKGPANADEWVNWAQGDPSQAAAVPLIQQCKPGGKYAFHWGVKLGMPNSSNTVLGYETKLPGSAGMVVMVDGSPREMTPAEFNAAAKPPKDDGKDAGKEKDKEKDKK
jgi:hypothetical protein